MTRAIDGDPATAWGIYPAVAQSHHAVFELAQPLDLPAGSSLTVSLKQLHGGSHLIGAFGLSVTDSPAAQTLALPRDVEEALAVDPAQRLAAQNLTIAGHVVRLAAEAELARLPAQATVFAAGPTVAIPLGGSKTLAAALQTPRLCICCSEAISTSRSRRFLRGHCRHSNMHHRDSLRASLRKSPSAGRTRRLDRTPRQRADLAECSQSRLALSLWPGDLRYAQ